MKISSIKTNMECDLNIPVGRPKRRVGRPKNSEKKSKKKVGRPVKLNGGREGVKLAAEKVIAKTASMQVAAALGKVPISTVYRAVKKLGKVRPVGKPTQLTESEEQVISDRIKLMGHWGFPLNKKSLRLLVKRYLDSLDEEKLRFPHSNMPTRQWAALYLRRHREVRDRITSCLCRAKSQVTREEVEDFIDKLSITLKDVPACNFWNYDETCFVQHPGKQKALFASGIKHAEVVGNTSKAKITVMFCISAGGDMVPPYVLYKGETTLEHHCEGGPPGTRYNTNAKGWFNGKSYLDWIKTQLIPYISKNNGRKVLIGDNLSSHLNQDAIRLCSENNIEYVLLPPNCTDKLQPLDVGVFGAMKSAWGGMVQAHLEGKDATVNILSKEEFPKRLNVLLSSIDIENSAPNTFEFCGLYPPNKKNACRSIPGPGDGALPEDLRGAVGVKIDQALIDLLTELRFPTSEMEKKVSKKRKPVVPPGESYCPDLQQGTSVDLVISDNPDIEECDSLQIEECDSLQIEDCDSFQLEEINMLLGAEFNYDSDPNFDFSSDEDETTSESDNIRVINNVVSGTDEPRKDFSIRCPGIELALNPQGKRGREKGRGGRRRGGRRQGGGGRGGSGRGGKGCGGKGRGGKGRGGRGRGGRGHGGRVHVSRGRGGRKRDLVDPPVPVPVPVPVAVNRCHEDEYSFPDQAREWVAEMEAVSGASGSRSNRGVITQANNWTFNCDDQIVPEDQRQEIDYNETTMFDIPPRVDIIEQLESTYSDNNVFLNSCILQAWMN